MFVSDNGILLGEHRWRFKTVPYEEDIHVPLLIRDDRLGPMPPTVGDLALNIDLAPTIAQVAGVQSPAAMDGRSLLPLLRARAGRWRTGFTIESASDVRLRRQAPSYCGYRTTRYMYVRYGTGEQELYDLRHDPFELTNVASDPSFAPIRRRMERLDRRGCAPVPPFFGNAWSRRSSSP
jgi:N-acetylglucosamine-6-sulfatase